MNNSLTPSETSSTYRQALTSRHTENEQISKMRGKLDSVLRQNSQLKQKVNILEEKSAGNLFDANRLAIIQGESAQLREDVLVLKQLVIKQKNAISEVWPHFTRLLQIQGIY